MRGEHTTAGTANVTAKGSSPHARGTQIWSAGTTAGAGIIPACAGNTNAAASAEVSERDHPRMRGEHLLAGYRRQVTWGSSPHARGTPSCLAIFKILSGIIPACAGNTLTGLRAGSS